MIQITSAKIKTHSKNSMLLNAFCGAECLVTTSTEFYLKKRILKKTMVLSFYNIFYLYYKANKTRQKRSVQNNVLQ